jgi:ankyrin repeat protein
MTADNDRAPTTEERHSEQLRLLLDGDIDDIEHPDERRRTRLHRAVQHGAEHAVAALLDAGADANSRDDWGNTPLWLAVYHHHEGSAVVEALTRRHADPLIENRHGVSALQLAEALAEDDTAVAAVLPLLADAPPADDAQQ